MNKCVFCGGLLKRETVTFHYDNDEMYMLVEQVPAEVCQQCGERLYTPEVIDALLRIARQKTEPIKILSVPVYNFVESLAVA